MIEIVEYVATNGRSPFRAWFDALDAQAAAIVTVTLARLASGNSASAKPVGEGVSELRINRWPGYRIYAGWDGKTLVVLLGGGTKRRQQMDIRAALERWRDYQDRQASGGTDGKRGKR